DLTAKKRGLILIVGPSGSGKSTSMASLINQRAQYTASHIITIEDPIEYIINHGESVVNQREVGVDTHSFHSALESALRQSPDALCIGEIRSKDTMEHALMFVDSGHFCMATLHANNTTQAIERILNFFPENKRDQILLGLSMNLKAIISQQLVPNLEGKLVAVFELLQASPRISDLIENADFAGMREVMEKDTSDMLTLDQSLFNLYENKIINSQTAMEYASSYSDMRLKMRLSNVASSLV
ncbi:MAG: ATPase, T2SS/T4P/T4SS family, partial [Gammaproteobacteria bacterium]|nr:ATPase, T2SS/T4P/T4SS family [Gammaproteobacteria bacterium]